MKKIKDLIKKAFKSNKQRNSSIFNPADLDSTYSSADLNKLSKAPLYATYKEETTIKSWQQILKNSNALPPIPTDWEILEDLERQLKDQIKDTKFGVKKSELNH